MEQAKKEDFIENKDYYAGKMISVIRENFRNLTEQKKLIRVLKYYLDEELLSKYFDRGNLRDYFKKEIEFESKGLFKLPRLDFSN